MNTKSLSARTDDELLVLTKMVLAEQGFEVEAVGGDLELIIAENNYFVVAVVAMNTIANLIISERVALDALSQRIESAVLGPKKWDTYLVLLTQEKSAEENSVTREIFSINHDTSRLRRIVHTGVDPTPDAVRHALAPFIRPIASPSSATHIDALGSLLHALVSNGIDEGLAQRAVAIFEQGGSLDDVL